MSEPSGPPLPEVSNTIGGFVSGSVVQAGTIAGGVHVHHGRPALGTDGIPPVGRVPATSGVFVGRADELARLDRLLDEQGRNAVAVVHGLGGVGKSTLAARFARLHAERFSLIWWITADTPAAIRTGFADLAVAVAPEAASLPVDERMEVAFRWLGGTEDWLLVLDNLATPADAEQVLARISTGTIVITSRQRTG
ncbi:MAG: ATP-binding protein, partial [Actinomycetota bacterium]|nr:ATP-binding protein [Actinomycetota bacterium]